MSKYRTDSVYAKTSVINNQYLGIWEPGSLDLNNTATMQVTLEPKHNNRPDVLANELYGNPKLWWVFAQFNPDDLIDPIMDFQSGMTLVVPTRFS
jgi:hypothetical protein